MADENEIGKIAALLAGAYVEGNVAAVKSALTKLPGGKLGGSLILAVAGYLVSRFGVEQAGQMVEYLADFLYGMAAGVIADPVMLTSAPRAAAAGTVNWGRIASIPLAHEII
ncbi:MAG: hypothetical protein QW688_07300 [Thermoprotei archaeon]